jgi:hypothetical protein
VIRSPGSSRAASRRPAPGDRARRSDRHTPRPPARSAGGRRARHGPGLPPALRGTRHLSRARGGAVRSRDRGRRLRDLVGRGDRAARHLRRSRDRDPRADRGAPRIRGRLRVHVAGRELVPAGSELSRLGRWRTRITLRPRPRQHDRGQPATDRVGLVDGGLHRVVPAAKGGRDATRALGGDRAHARSLDRARIPVGGDALLAHVAPQRFDHVDRHAGSRRAVRRLHLARLESAGRAAPSRRSREVPGLVPGRRTPGVCDRAVRGFRHGAHRRPPSSSSPACSRGVSTPTRPSGHSSHRR